MKRARKGRRVLVMLEKPMRSWERFGTGAVVEWRGDLFIVGSRSGSTGLELISMRHNRMTAYPTETWPSDREEPYEDPKTGEELTRHVRGERVDTVKLVAGCVADFIRDRVLSRNFPELFQ